MPIIFIFFILPFLFLLRRIALSFFLLQIALVFILWDIQKRVQNQMRCRKTQRMIRSCTVCPIDKGHEWVLKSVVLSLDIDWVLVILFILLELFFILSLFFILPFLS